MCRLLALLALFGTLCSGCTDTSYRGSLRVYVAEPYVPLVQAQASAFQRLYPGVSFQIVSSTAREALVALVHDSTRLIFIDRPVNEEERQALQQAKVRWTEVEAAKDAVIFITGTRGERREVRQNELPSLFTTDYVIMTGRNSGIHETLALRLARRRPLELRQVAGTQRHVIDAVSRNVNAVGVVAMAELAVRRAEGVRVLGIRTDSVLVMPSPVTVYSGEYPLRLSVSYIAAAEAGDAASAFLSFTRTQYGQKLVQKRGLVPVVLPARHLQLDAPQD